MTNDQQYVYIGRYASDITHSSLFSGAIVSHGITKANQCRFSYSHDHLRYVTTGQDREEKALYVKDAMNRVRSRLPNPRFMFFAQNYLDDLIPGVDRNQFVCLNDQWLNDLIDSKIYMRQWAKSYCATPPHFVTTLAACSYDFLKSSFERQTLFIQNEKGRGGFGSFIVRNRQDYEKLLSLQGETPSLLRRMIASPFYEDAIHINQHAMIGKVDTIVFQPSLEILRYNEIEIKYYGANYGAFLDLDAKKHLRVQIDQRSAAIAKGMQNAGYRGIVGFDYLFVHDKLWFVEANPRFQGSSPLLSKALAKAGLPDLYTLNLHAFADAPIDEETIRALSSFTLSAQIEYQYSFSEMLDLRVSYIDGALTPGIYISPGARLGISLD